MKIDYKYVKTMFIKAQHGTISQTHDNHQLTATYSGKENTEKCGMAQHKATLIYRAP